MNTFRIPFAIVAFLISVVLAVTAYLDISEPIYTPFSKFLATVNPIMTAFLGRWVTRDTQRKQQLADDYLYDLT